MRIRKLIIVPLLMLAFAGCIKDDLSQCRPEQNVTVWFTYHDGEDGTPLADYIETADLFLFDAEGRYLMRHRVGKGELTAAEPSVSLSLSPGTYYVMAWGNVGDNSAYQKLTEGVTQLEECLLEIEPANTRTGDPVCYAPRKPLGNVTDTRPAGDLTLYELIVPNRGSVEKTLEFVRAHRTIYVWIRGLYDAGDQAPTVEAKNLWSRYDFLYRTHQSRRNYIQQSAVQVMDGKEYAVAVFHHAYGDIDDLMNVNVSRTSNGELSHTVNVRSFLEENPHSSTDDIHIMLTFLQNLGVTVSLPQWAVKSIQPGID